ncbi:acyl-ACP thioesterase domain-containing protein [Nocardia sp. CDC153]|uniref:acyl-ACP thioesterase domain-containing protein n=1 Tax=Nocardia sp. CDC153 TaxID=3112167 RepID=UPI002DBF3859|nr:acyl-ACP thioesterase domain-containing protein [Nocardia sp. CDC153]MEC3958482.1 acyl-ACP thioesterase domain-containing protein [Nocardia sp. CDC153]
MDDPEVLPMMNQLEDRPSLMDSHPLTRALAPVPTSGHIFDVTRRLGTVDMDEHQYLRVDGIARHLQDAGVDHLIHCDALESHPHWICRRTVIDVLRPVTWPSQLRIRRWCSGISPRWCTMRVRIDSDTGGLIETEGFWIHMNKDTMAPSRVADEFFDLMCTTTDDHRLRWRQWLDAPLPATPGTRFPLRRTDTDHFQHITNTAYWHAVHEFTADTPELTQSPHRFVLEYNKPIRYGEALDIHTSRTDDTVTLWFAVDGDTRAIAQLRPATF